MNCSAVPSQICLGNRTCGCSLGDDGWGTVCAGSNLGTFGQNSSQSFNGRLRVGDSTAPEDLAAWLVEHGFQRMEAVELPGEFSRRGGILDIFSPDAETPYRLEFFGDDIESIRQFAADNQRSLGDVQAVEITAARGAPSAIAAAENSWVTSR